MRVVYDTIGTTKLTKTGVKIRPIGTRVFSDSQYETRESLPSLFRLSCKPFQASLILN